MPTRRPKSPADDPPAKRPRGLDDPNSQIWPPMLADVAGVPVGGIQDYALVGNLHTAACVGLSGSIESMCIPNFDSPSVFARVVDANKGGHFSIRPVTEFKPKQDYAPNSNVLVTKFLSEGWVGAVTDLMVRRDRAGKVFLPWLVRKVESLHGTTTFRMECAPAFNYCMDKHTAELVHDFTSDQGHDKVNFSSENLNLDLRWLAAADDHSVPPPELKVSIETLPKRGLLGPSAVSDFTLQEGQVAYFILRQMPENPMGAEIDPAVFKDKARHGITAETVRAAAQMLCPDDDPHVTQKSLEVLKYETDKYWHDWIARCKYRGRWREAVRRSALVLKMLVYEPTGAIVAAPTFSLPEYIGGTRNWDYRYTWVRDSSFTLYAFIRLGFTDEANAFMAFILERLKDRNSDGMYTIHGGKDIPEMELHHLEGHKGSRPVRVGNGAADHLQLDIYGELMDCVYLAQKYSAPLAWESWIAIRQVIDYVCTMVNEPDLSIWEPRGEKKNYTYSKVMMWVALDRGLRLAEKRCLPCPNRDHWLKTKDRLYEDIQMNSWNPKRNFFGQSWEEKDHLDSAVLIMPLVFFISGADPRFTSTLDNILKTPEKGGLTINNSIFRYNTDISDDGIGGEEGAFSLCTLWGVEALTRAGVYNKKYLERAESMFIEFLGYGNHVALYSEEISPGGEGLGNTPQAFSHVTLISAAFNLDRTLG